MLCPEGFVCYEGTGLGQMERQVCPADRFCPTGTADAYMGYMADDSVNRGLTAEEANPFLNMQHLKVLSDHRVDLVSDHDRRCFDGADTDLKMRYRTRWLNEYDISNSSQTIDFLRVSRADRWHDGFLPYTEDDTVNLRVECADLQAAYDAKNFDDDFRWLDDEQSAINMTNASTVPRRPSCAYRPSVVNLAIEQDLTCGRDHKWRLVKSAEERLECDCRSQALVLMAVYRLWKCTAVEPLDDLGLASTQPLVSTDGEEIFYGGRAYWFDRTDRTEGQCVFNDAAYVNFTAGRIDPSLYSNAMPPKLPKTYENGEEIWPNATLDMRLGLTVQVTWARQMTFYNYSTLKEWVNDEWAAERNALPTGSGAADGVDRTDIDPYVYDLKNAIRLIEEYGERVEELVEFEWNEEYVTDYQDNDGKPYYQVRDEPTWYDYSTKETMMVPTLTRLDVCDCSKLLLCPNGTTSGDSILTTESQCVSSKVEVLRRVNAIPSFARDYKWYQRPYDQRWFHNSSFGPETGVDMFLRNYTDFAELGGASYKNESYPIGSMYIRTFEVAVVTLDLSFLANNLTYNDHYRLAVYIECKPCPTRYICDYTQDPPTCPTYPSLQLQDDNFKRCLDNDGYKQIRCINGTGMEKPCDSPDPCLIEYKEPDLYKCEQMPFYCDSPTARCSRPTARRRAPNLCCQMSTM